MIFLLARAIHREHILVTVFLKKEIATAKELDLRPLGKVIIFRDKQTDRSFPLYDPIRIQVKTLSVKCEMVIFYLKRSKGTVSV